VTERATECHTELLLPREIPRETPHEGLVIWRLCNPVCAAFVLACARAMHDNYADDCPIGILLI
jgi:hypothetical protein